MSSPSVSHAVNASPREEPQVLDGLETTRVEPVSGTKMELETGAVEDTNCNTTITTSTAETLKPMPGPFQGDGADPSQAAVLIPQRSALNWLAYSVSLNYNRLATSVFAPITRWRWFDPIPHSCLVLGAVPSQQFLEQVQREQSVENIVNMCAEFEGHLETMKTLGLVQCWVPTPDFHVPTVDSIWIGIRFISKCQARWQDLDESQRGHVYIHCK
ncbi:hypothetical protein BGZ65_005797, partial [Modicella reniformis]